MSEEPRTPPSRMVPVDMSSYSQKHIVYINGVRQGEGRALVVDDYVSELNSLSLSALRRRAVEGGISQMKIDEAYDSEEKREAFIQLLLNHKDRREEYSLKFRPKKFIFDMFAFSENDDTQKESGRSKGRQNSEKKNQGIMTTNEQLRKERDEGIQQIDDMKADISALRLKNDINQGEIRSLKTIITMFEETIKEQEYTLDECEDKIDSLGEEKKKWMDAALKTRFLFDKIKQLNGFKDSAEDIVECFEDIVIPEISEQEKGEFIPSETTVSFVATTLEQDREHYGEDFIEDGNEEENDDDVVYEDEIVGPDGLIYNYYSHLNTGGVPLNVIRDNGNFMGVRPFYADFVEGGLLGEYEESVRYLYDEEYPEESEIEPQTNGGEGCYILQDMNHILPRRNAQVDVMNIINQIINYEEEYEEYEEEPDIIGEDNQSDTSDSSYQTTIGMDEE